MAIEVVLRIFRLCRKKLSSFFVKARETDAIKRQVVYY